MVVMSAFVLIRDFGKWNLKYVFYCLLGLAVGLSLTFLGWLQKIETMVCLFLWSNQHHWYDASRTFGLFLLILLGNYALLLVDAVNAVWEFSVQLLQNLSIRNPIARIQ